MKIKRFEDIEAWKEARELLKMIYQYAKNKEFSKDYRLRDQIIGAGISVMNNIAEGFDSQCNNEFIRFLKIARRSVSEIETCLYAAIDQNYINGNEFKEAFDRCEKERQLIDGFLRYLRNYKLTTPVKLTNLTDKTRLTNSTNQTKHGFTLIEMLMVLSIFSLVIGIVYTALRANDVQNGLIRVQVELYRQNQRVISSITNELKESNLPTRVVIQNGTGVNNTDIIYFQVPIGLDNNYQMIWGADGTAGHFIRYRLDDVSHKLFLLRDRLDTVLTPVAGTEQQKAYKIVDVQFADNALDGSVPAGCIRITSTARKQTPDRHDVDLTTNSLVYLEN